MSRARRSFVPHCCFCFASEGEVELKRVRNGITGTVTIWCVDAAACRERQARQ